MRIERLFQKMAFLFLCCISGYLLSLTGISIGWMIGSLITGGILSICKPHWLMKNSQPPIISNHWVIGAQIILGIELGKKLNTDVISIFTENWIFIFITLFISILFSLLTGIILWKFSHVDLLTSLIGTAPGGITYLPLLAEEIGANTSIVSIIQIVRMILVISTMPFIIYYWSLNHKEPLEDSVYLNNLTASFDMNQLYLTVTLILFAVISSFIAKCLKFPSPWLLGSMIFLSIIQIMNQEIDFWWPHWFIIVSQVLIGANLGARLNTKLFNGLKNIILVSSLTSISLIILMALSATIVSKLTDLSWITTILAFSPGGISEMAVTATTLNANSTFVVAVQVLRITIVLMLLPPLFNFLNRTIINKEKQKNHI